MHEFTVVLIPASTPDEDVVAVVDRLMGAQYRGEWKIGGRYDGILHGVPVRSEVAP